MEHTFDFSSFDDATIKEPDPVVVQWDQLLWHAHCKLSVAQTWDHLVLPLLVGPYLALRAATEDGWCSPLDPSPIACKVGHVGNTLEVMCVTLDRTFVSLGK